jgi:hypothetical protein
MKIETIDVEATIENTRKLLENDPGVFPALKAAIELLLTLVILMINQLTSTVKTAANPPQWTPIGKRQKRRSETAKPEDKKGIPGPPCKNLMNLTASRISPSTENRFQKGNTRMWGMRPGKLLFPAVRSQRFLKVFCQSVCKEEPGMNRVLHNGRHQSTGGDRGPDFSGSRILVLE